MASRESEFTTNYRTESFQVRFRNAGQKEASCGRTDRRNQEERRSVLESAAAGRKI